MKAKKTILALVAAAVLGTVYPGATPAYTVVCSNCSDAFQQALQLAQEIAQLVELKNQTEEAIRQTEMAIKNLERLGKGLLENPAAWLRRLANLTSQLNTYRGEYNAILQVLNELYPEQADLAELAGASGEARAGGCGAGCGASARRAGQRRRGNEPPDGPHRAASAPAARSRPKAKAALPRGPSRSRPTPRLRSRSGAEPCFPRPRSGIGKRPTVRDCGGHSEKTARAGWDRETTRAKAGVHPPSERRPRDRPLRAAFSRPRNRELR